MKVVSPYEELKNWFDINNYVQVKSLTIKELYKELVFRELILDSINFEWEDDDQNLKSILNGNPILSQEVNHSEHFIKRQTHIEQVSFEDLRKQEKKLVMFDVDCFDENGDFKKELKGKPITQTMRELFLNKNNSKMYCKHTCFSSTHFLRVPVFQPSAGILPASGYSGIHEAARCCIPSASAL